MPPSPSLRRSPGWEFRMESSHKRGQSYESGLPLKAKDDDLVLFNEMQNPKLRYFTDFKLGINIQARGESSDLLNADGEKNDYDWLLTPPDTPLFHSLDDDETQLVNLFRGRTRTQPISFSKTSKNEKTPRASRSSASPHRLSPSPRSSYIAVQSRTRPSSAPRSSPPAVVRSTTPSRRSSTPPAKPSMPTPRSSTPTLRRMSTGSSGPAFSSDRRGTSPVKSSRGNSASPKLRGWQSDLPGFSMNAPPNLLTSLPERSTSQSRGLSPAYTGKRNSSSKFGRQSISPSASRSASSSHSHERDQCISYSRTSVASSGDDDADSMLSVSVGVSDNSAVRKYGTFANSRPLAFSKKSSRSPSASSAQKRSSDSTLRQTDRKTPQNMFRPLLSCVPATTFYAGKTTIVHRPMFSRNSSLTASSNASSDHGASFAPDMEDSDHDQSEMAGEWEKIKDPEIQEEIFSFDKSDELTEDTHDEKLSSCNENYDENMTTKVKSIEPQQTFTGDAFDLVDATPFPQSLDSAKPSVVYHNETMNTCSKCGREFLIIDVDGEHDICQECAAVDGLLASGEIEASVISVQDEDTLGNKVHLRMGLLKLPEKESSDVICRRDEINTEQDTDCCLDICPIQLVVDSGDQKLHDLEVDSLGKVNAPESGSQLPSEPTAYPGLKVSNPEGTGISVLLMQRSSSSKWSVVQGRVFSATNIPCSEPSYTRDNMITMKHSFGRESSSASSSVDLGSSRLTDGRVLRQLSSRKGEMDNVKNSCILSAQSTDSHSETSMHATEPLVHPLSEPEKVFCSTLGTMENDVMNGSLVDTEKQVKSYQIMNFSVLDCSSSEQAGIGEDLSVCSGASIASSNMYTQLSSQQLILQLCDTSVADNLDDENCAASENAGEVFFQHVEICIPDTEPVATPVSLFNEDIYALNDANCVDNVSDAAPRSSSVLILEELIDQDCHQDSLNECTSSQLPCDMEDFQEVSISNASDKDFVVTESTNFIELPTCEEPRASVEAPRKHVQRSFTLEEATDTILFCSSIVHDMAYKAVMIGMEKEMTLHDAPRPAVTDLGKYVSNQMDLRSIPSKRAQSTRKVKRKRLETDNKVPTTELGNTVNDQEPAHSNAIVSSTVDSMKPPPKLESKCNCTVM